MKSLLSTIILAAAMLSVSALAQEAKTVDEYCVTVSNVADRSDKLYAGMEATIPSFAPEHQAAARKDVAALREINKQIRKDACFAPNLATAVANVKRDTARASALSVASIARVTHDMAEERRKQAAQ